MYEVWLNCECDYAFQQSQVKKRGLNFLSQTSTICSSNQATSVVFFLNLMEKLTEVFGRPKFPALYLEHQQGLNTWLNYRKLDFKMYVITLKWYNLQFLVRLVMTIMLPSWKGAAEQSRNMWQFYSTVAKDYFRASFNIHL